MPTITTIHTLFQIQDVEKGRIHRLHQIARSYSYSRNIKVRTLTNTPRRKGSPHSRPVILAFCFLEPGGEDITIDGTIKFCADLEVNPEDVVLLAIAYELKSPGIGQWTKQGWMEGWRFLGYVCVFFFDLLVFLFSFCQMLEFFFFADSNIIIYKG